MTRGERVIEFIEGYLVVPDGSLRGQRFQLLPFQKRFIRDVYDNPAGTRHAILSIGRKNGKTALMACLVLAHVCGPEAQENSQIESGARSRDQAAKLYKYAADIARMSPSIRHRVTCKGGTKQIVGKKKNVTYTALAAEATSAHGGSPVLALRDEVGQVKGPTDDFFTAMETSQGAHDAPLLIDISTQAPTDGALLSIMIDDALSGNDPKIVCHLYAADEDADIMDREQWEKANPALGVFRSLADMEALAQKAERMPTKEWDENAGAPGEFVGPVWAGLDLSQTTDLTAFVLVGKNEAGQWAVRPRFWMAGDLVGDLAKRDRAPYELWARQGYLYTPPGKSIDYGAVAREIGDMVRGLDLKAVCFDRWQIAAFKRHCELEGVSLPLEPWGQGWASMSPAVSALEVELLHGRLAHGAHPVLAMCAANAVVKRDEAGNRKLDKAKSTGRIDGMVALAMAIAAAAENKAEDAASEPVVMVF